MSGDIHIELAVEGAPPERKQPVEVRQLGADEYLVLYSPGWVEGIAAGDVVRLLDASLGTFEVVRRGGNLAIKFAYPEAEALGPIIEDITRGLTPLGGRLDGAIRSAAVWTVPVASGFSQVEEVMNAATAQLAGSGWWYGNVYDADGKPLLWWETPELAFSLGRGHRAR